MTLSFCSSLYSGAGVPPVDRDFRRLEPLARLVAARLEKPCGGQGEGKRRGSCGMFRKNRDARVRA